MLATSCSCLLHTESSNNSRGSRRVWGCAFSALSSTAGKLPGIQDVASSKLQPCLPPGQGQEGEKQRGSASPAVRRCLVLSIFSDTSISGTYTGTPRGREQCSRASLTWNLVKYHNHHGLGPHWLVPFSWASGLSSAVSHAGRQLQS